MSNTLIIVGVIIASALIAIPLIFLARLAAGMIAASRDHRRREALKIVRVIPEIGECTSYGDGWWFGSMDDIQIAIKSSTQSPEPWQINLARMIVTDPDVYAGKARRLIAMSKDDLLPNGVDKYQIEGVAIAEPIEFVLEMFHPADDDGIYRVTFRDGDAVSWGRED